MIVHLGQLCRNFGNVLTHFFQMMDRRMESNKKTELCLMSKILCEVCNKHFKTKSTLRQHIQTSHKGLKYSCDLCEYQATQKGSLKTHIQSVHEKIKYSCDQCEYQATQQGNLKTHIKSVHEKTRG